MASNDIKLTDKQKLFIKEYLVDLNGTQAAIRAGYSEDSAKVIACENLTKPYIQEAIQKEMDKRVKKIEITAEYVLNGIKEVIENAEQDTSKLKGYELLGKHLKLFTEKQEVDMNGKFEITMSDEVKELAK